MSEIAGGLPVSSITSPHETRPPSLSSCHSSICCRTSSSNSGQSRHSSSAERDWPLRLAASQRWRRSWRRASADMTLLQTNDGPYLGSAAEAPLSRCGAGTETDNLPSDKLLGYGCPWQMKPAQY